MDPLRLIAEQHGVFVTQEALGVGYDDRGIARAVRAGLWHRVRRGAYVPKDVWDVADVVERHRILACAVHRSYGDRVAFSHTTAAVLLGLATWNLDLSRVHVTRLDGGAGRTEPDVVHHEGFCLDDGDVVERDGRLITTPGRAALETGILTTVESSLVTIDSLLHHELCDPEELANRHDVMQHWPGAQHLQVAMRLADGRAESPGESRSRYLFFAHGIPAPELQFEVRDHTGALIGITDFAWPAYGLLGEFDGRVKYERFLKPGQLPGDAVFAEKVREDALRLATGWRMVRLIWADLGRALQTADRLRRLLVSAAA